METSNFKNMIKLRNLPSNIIEEAIVIFKETQNVKQKELINKVNKININEKESKSKDYILKEAEMLLSDYISDIEKNQQEKQKLNIITPKYKILKRYSICSTLLLLLSLLINFI